MTEVSARRSSYDDPRRLRELFSRARELATAHALRSVVVGLAGFEGDLEFPEIVDFVESALRVDDSLFRMTRERAVMLLTDVDEKGAAGIVERLLNDYRDNFPAATEPAVALGFYEVAPGDQFANAKRVLPQIFSQSPQSH